MKRILTINSLLLFFTVGFFSCEKFAEDTPPAIKKIIRENKKEITRVTEYKCDEKIIYLVEQAEQGIPEAIFDLPPVYIYDKKGNMLCEINRGAKFVENFKDCIGECKNSNNRIIWLSKEEKI